MRKLLWVPVIHSSAEFGSLSSEIGRKGAKFVGENEWKRHQAILTGFWHAIASHFDSFPISSNVKIYQDGLIVGNTAAKELVQKIANGGSKNHQLLLKLAEKGAVLMKTEDLALVKEEAALVKKLVQARNFIEKALAFVEYKLNKNRLLKKRDEFIAKTINATLGLDETAILFLGAYHNIKPFLDKDIQLIELKQQSKIVRYQKTFYLKTLKEKTKELEKYLVSPIAWEASA